MPGEATCPTCQGVSPGHCEWPFSDPYVPDLPGCVAAGKSRDEVERLIREAIAFRIEGTRGDGEPVPEPSSAAILIKVA